MKVTINFNQERFRYSLVGDGYTLEEVEKLTEDELIKILEQRISEHIDREFYYGKEIGLYDVEI